MVNAFNNSNKLLLITGVFMIKEILIGVIISITIISIDIVVKKVCKKILSKNNDK